LKFKLTKFLLNVISGTGGIPIAKSIRRSNNLHAPSPTTNFLTTEGEDGDDNQVGTALGPTEEQVRNFNNLNFKVQRNMAIFYFLKIILCCYCYELCFSLGMVRNFLLKTKCK
jgi:hypothetical protein